MRHFLQFICIASLLSVESFSNPLPNPYYLAGISEVYFASPSDWYVELDGTWCLYESKNTVFPCSVDVYLQIRSSKYRMHEFCRARVGFAANKFGIISQASLRLTERQMNKFNPLPLFPTDTVFVAMDTARIYMPLLSKKCWWFPLRPVPEGNSIVAFINAPPQTESYSTARRSIGSPGNYVTRYKITVLDRYKNPLEGIKFVRAQSGHSPYFSTDSTGTGYFTMSIRYENIYAEVLDDQTPHLPDVVRLSSLELSYNDKDSTIDKTIEIPNPVTQYRLTLEGTGLNSYLYAFKEDQGVYLSTSLRKINNSVPWFFRVYNSEPVCRICFSPALPAADSQCLGTWIGKYVDTSAIINKTISIAPNPIVSTRKPEPPGVQSGITLSGLCENNREVRMVVSSALPATNGSLYLYAINGKQITSQPLAMNGAGTSTVLFRFPGGQLAPGRYLCKLTIAGSKAAACPVTVP